MIKRLAVRWSFLFPIYLLAAAALNAPSPLRFGTPGIDARLSLAVIAAALFFVPARYSGWPMALTGAIGAWRTALFMGFGPAPPDLGLAALSIFCGAIGFGRLATQGGWARRFAEFALSAAPLALAAGRGQWIAAAVALGFAAVGASRRNATPDPRGAAALIGLLLTAGGVLGIRGVEWRREAGVREALAELPAAKADQPYERIFFQRGVSFTAEGGARYGSKESRQMLAALVAYGVDAIALIP